jgi:GNAT superfamily N-acetyltransferase
MNDIKDQATDFVIDTIDGERARALVPALATVLIDCVERGASVSFMSPLTRAKAEAFWSEVAASVGRGERTLLVATTDDQVVGTVQVVDAGPENQPHRADVAKMLVHSGARRCGIGAALMRAAEAAARENGKTILVLDTVTGSDAERLYARLGWHPVGTVPDYALFPDGRLCATTFFYKAV